MLTGIQPKHWAAILIDPPWHYKTWTQSKDHQSSRNVTRHYRTMTNAEIAALPISDLAAPTGCHLFLWSTGPQLPVALDIMRGWGFRYSGIGFVWIKLKRSFDGAQLRVLPTIEHDLHVGLGFTTRKNAEFVLLGRRGSAKRVARDVREVILSPVRQHSRKPEAARERIERYCAGPYLELFGRSTRQGWTVLGDEVGKFPCDGGSR